MDNVILYSIGSVVLVSLISLIGLFTISLHSKMGRTILVFLVSFSAGALLGDVFIHLLPELASTGLNAATSLYILLSIVLFFILERFIHWHHYHNERADNEHATQPFVFLNLIGDGLHNFIDGLIIGGAYLLDIKLGIATTIAVVLHEIPQEVGDFGILVYGGLSKNKALFFNFLSALTAVAGTIIALLLGTHEGFISFLIALAIGSFIYIATADLIPEIHKEKTNHVFQLISFILGIAVMYLLLLIE